MPNFIVCKKIYHYLEDQGNGTNLNIVDNETSAAIKKVLTKLDVEYQLVEKHRHRTSAEECAIHTFKKHFIVSLCTTERQCLLQF